MINQEEQEKNKLIIQLSDEHPVLMNVQFSNCGYMDDTDLRRVLNIIDSEYHSTCDAFYYGHTLRHINFTFHTYRCLKSDLISRLQDELTNLYKRDVIFDEMFIPRMYSR